MGLIYNDQYDEDATKNKKEFLETLKADNPPRYHRGLPAHHGERRLLRLPFLLQAPLFL